jgi:U3 small nucleolar RNA-associated protein MPP10
MYKEFFMPPPQKASKAQGRRVKFANEQPTEVEPDEDMEKVVDRVHRDLFEDDDDLDGESDLSDVDPATPKARQSTHQRRQAKIAEEIRKLEAANVAKREWQVSSGGTNCTLDILTSSLSYRVRPALRTDR